MLLGAWCWVLVRVLVGVCFVRVICGTGLNDDGKNYAIRSLAVLALGRHAGDADNRTFLLLSGRGRGSG